MRELEKIRHEIDWILSAINSDEDSLSVHEREKIVRRTVGNFENHVNKGFLKQRKSVTEAGDFAVTEWTGQGSIIVDALGREFIDFLGGFGLYAVGIRHPAIVKAVQNQLNRSPQYSQELLDPLRAQLAHLIALLAPGDIQCGFFCNSGTEAVEGALKLARLHTGKQGFITMEKGFHGKTMGSLSVMGKDVFRKPFLPLLEGVQRVPFGDAGAVEKALASSSEKVAAVIAEPVQGEAGAIVPPDDFWPRLRQICDTYHVLLIADEVQTGFGRTGKIFGVDHWDIAPDIICLGKALGGGVVAASAFFSTPKIWKCMEPNPFIHTTTTGGNPIACAAALAHLSVMLDEDTPGQAKEKGDYILRELFDLKNAYPKILKEVRGKGLLLGMEFFSPEMGYKVASGLFSRGVLTSGTLNNARNIRIEPALNISYKLIDKALLQLKDVLAAL